MIKKFDDVIDTINQRITGTENETSKVTKFPLQTSYAQNVNNISTKLFSRKRIAEIHRHTKMKNKHKAVKLRNDVS